MKHLCFACALIGATFGPSMSIAQPSGSSVTLNVPVSLKNMDPLVTGFTVDCNLAYSDSPAGVYVTGPGLAYGRVDLPLKGGGYTGNVAVTLVVSSDPSKINGYWCRLSLATASGGLQPQQGGTGPAIAQAAPGTKFVWHIEGTFPAAPPLRSIPK